MKISSFGRGSNLSQKEKSDESLNFFLQEGERTTVLLGGVCKEKTTRKLLMTEGKRNKPNEKGN